MDDELTVTPSIVLRLDCDASRVLFEDTVAGSALSVRTLLSVGEVVAALESGGAQAIVADVRVGADVMTSLVAEIERRELRTPLVCVADVVDDASVAMAAHLGAAGLLPRPCTQSMLLEVLRQAPTDAGYCGTATSVPTASLLTLYGEAERSGTLHLRCTGSSHRDARSGSLYLDRGQPVHASAGEHVGADAVHAMLSWPDAEATFLPGQPACPRTIVGRWSVVGGLARTLRSSDFHSSSVSYHVGEFPGVTQKLARLTQTPDVLGAYLMRHAAILAGECVDSLDAPLAERSLCRLAHVFFDVDAQPHEDAGHEIQAIVGTARLVIDRVGPRELGYQVGVLVRQAAPVCKSLRRLLRQIDATFAREVQCHQSAA